VEASPDDRRTLDRAVQLLRASRSLLFITGAGISADSGLPTYRGVGGVYQVDKTEDGVPIEEALSGHMFRTRPELTWKHLADLERASRGATFNRGHAVIALMERHFDRVVVLTQNVDGFHRRAGSSQVIDIHGDLHHLQCTACPFRQSVESYRDLAIPPPCPSCAAIMRPDVVLFGEMLCSRKLERLRDELAAGFDLVFTIGTTSVFPYIAEPVVLARQTHCPTIEINPGTSEVSHLVDIKIAHGAAAALDAIWNRYLADRP